MSCAKALLAIAHRKPQDLEISTAPWVFVPLAGLGCAVDNKYLERPGEGDPVCMACVVPYRTPADGEPTAGRGDRGLFENDGIVLIT